jgi:hypothetical protein
LCIQLNADDASGAGQSPSDIPVGDEFADGVLVGGSGCLAGSSRSRETTNSFRSCSTEPGSTGWRLWTTSPGTRKSLVTCDDGSS